MNREEAHYVKNCELTIEDMKNHLDQCTQEAEHYRIMLEHAEKQIGIANKRLLHEKTGLETYKAGLS